MYCGGSNLSNDDMIQVATTRLIDVVADNSCIKMTPSVSLEWEDDDPLPEGRAMGNGILLPDGTLFVVNGAQKVSIIPTAPPTSGDFIKSD